LLRGAYKLEDSEIYWYLYIKGKYGNKKSFKTIIKRIYRRQLRLPCW
jgi:hypothetical protein